MMICSIRPIRVRKFIVIRIAIILRLDIDVLHAYHIYNCYNALA